MYYARKTWTAHLKVVYECPVHQPSHIAAIGHRMLYLRTNQLKSMCCLPSRLVNMHPCRACRQCCRSLELMQQQV